MGGRRALDASLREPLRHPALHVAGRDPFRPATREQRAGGAVADVPAQVLGDLATEVGDVGVAALHGLQPELAALEVHVLDVQQDG
jgi:hypothetical protein